MKKIFNFCNKINEEIWFQYLVILIILINSFLIGLETYFTNSYILGVQKAALIFFTFELIIRFLANPTKNFFKDVWNIFDLTIVLIAYIPESLFYNSHIIIALRILRILRVFRLLRAFSGVKIIFSVLVRSCQSLGYSSIFFLIFIYFYAILGVSLFRLPSENIDTAMQQKLIQFQKIAPNSPSIAPDPYGSLDESAFTLFRILTGEDWTDIRYNLILASKMGLIQTPSFLITIYHTSWFIISAFLLLNLLVAAVVNNYSEVIKELGKKKK